MPITNNCLIITSKKLQVSFGRFIYKYYVISTYISQELWVILFLNRKSLSLPYTWILTDCKALMYNILVLQIDRNITVAYLVFEGADIYTCIEVDSNTSAGRYSPCSKTSFFHQQNCFYTGYPVPLILQLTYYNLLLTILQK